MNRLNAAALAVALVAGTAMTAAAQSVLDTIPIGAKAQAIAVNAATNKAYAVGGMGNTLVEIDGLTGAAVTIPLQATNDIAHAEVVVNQNTNTIYVTNVVSSNVAVVNGTTRAVSFIPLGAMTGSIALNVNTNRIYVTHFDAAMVSVIDGVTKNVTTVPVGFQPSAIVVNQKTNRIYVANIGSNTVSVISGVDHSVTPVPVGSYPMELALDENGNRIFVVNLLSDSLTIITGSTNATQVVALPPGSRPHLAAYNPDQKRVYVAFQFPGNLAVVNPGNRTFQMLATGAFVTDMVVDKWRNKVYLADPTANQLVVLDGATLAKTTVPNLGTHLWALALNTLTNVVHGASLTSDSVTVFAGAPAPIPWATFKALKLH
jgi:YVTN family beta-propeller protein